jgi:predicted SAM-dependent methyltransferase
MPLNTVSLHRPLTSYAKVQAWIGPVLRNRKFQLRRPRVRACAYLDIGCGLNTHAGFINLDYQWRPGVDVCWDIRNGLPFGDGSMRGVFSEHCLEHFSPPAALALLREIRRVLAPGGTARFVVPDGELYLRTYVRQLDGDLSQPFPYQETERQIPHWTPMLSVNRIYYQDRESAHGHHVIYDFQLLAALLMDCGFSTVRRRTFGESDDPLLAVDSPGRRSESLYVEAGILA